jgi:adenine-specific DNA-methyltransferase
MADKPKNPASYKHPDAKRKMIPTAEQQGFVAEDEARPKKLRYPRNADLDPQFVWKGKDQEDLTDLLVDAPPIYKQEHIHPRAIIARLKAEAARADAGDDPDDQMSMFAEFNGRPKDIEAHTEFYEHDQDWQNRMILGDSLMVMASLAERENLRGQVQAVYFDPPYGIKFNSNWQASTASRDVTDGRVADTSREPEVIRAFRDTWRDGIHSYMSYLRDRLVLARDLLTDSGSIFVQIGDENVHRVRALLDEVFGEANFINTIVFKKKSATLSTETVYDLIVWYAKSAGSMKLRELFENRSNPEGESKFNSIVLPSGAVENVSSISKAHLDRVLADGGSWARVNYPIVSQHPSDTRSVNFRFRGVDKSCGNNKQWRFDPETQMPRLEKAGRLFDGGGESLGGVMLWKDWSLVGRANIWEDMHGEKYPTYVVQTATSAVQRCLLMTTDPGDLVLDPTCGSGTTAYVAEQWGRRWITIDTSRVALALARARLMGAKYPFYHLKDSASGAMEEAKLTGKPPVEGPFKGEIRQHFVYKRVPHITLKSIAINTAIDTIWETWQQVLEPLRTELNAAAQRDWQEWQIPRPPVYPWDDKAAKLHAKIVVLQEERADIAAAIARGDEEFDERDLIKLEKALAKQLKALNAALNRSYMLATLPEHAGDPLPEAALPIHAKWWEARRARQAEIDDSIAKNADVEYLFDQPIPDKKITRVAGPFTVESLSPYRVIPSEDDPAILDMLRGENGDLPPRTVLREETDFAEVVMEHLKKAGVQNTKKGERLTFDSVQPWAGRGYVAFEGRYEENGATRRAAIAIGPEWDAVGYEFVRNAAREAADYFDVLIVCAFQFSPDVDESRLNFGRLKVMKARMNQDIRMGDRLKNTGAGNLFVVFGEPDIAPVKRDDGLLQFEIRGVDIFDPTTGEVKSSANPREDIACWFIDDEYDQEAFFVRQAYFLGAKESDPYKALKRALKAEIDEEAWEMLHTTVSMPFPRPKSGMICVKVINHFGDEVQKVFRV